MLVGWSAPAMYATHAPSDHFVETHEFTAEDVSIDDGTHELTWDRTIHGEHSGFVIIELVMVSDDERIEYESTTRDSIYQDGRHKVVIENELPDNVEAGTYKYHMSVEMQLADGRVTRSFFVEGDSFIVTE